MQPSSQGILSACPPRHISNNIVYCIRNAKSFFEVYAHILLAKYLAVVSIKASKISKNHQNILIIETIVTGSILAR
jgi:hypothetical protein